MRLHLYETTHQPVDFVSSGHGVHLRYIEKHILEAKPASEYTCLNSLRECESEVCGRYKDHELSKLDKVAKMLYGLINPQEFPIKRIVSLLNSLELLRIVRDRAPLSSKVLLQN